MNKSQLIEQISLESGISKVDALKAINSFVSITSDTLKQGERVTISGFGTFSVAGKQGRVGRNPRTGEQVKIEPKKVAKFKASPELSNIKF